MYIAEIINYVVVYFWFYSYFLTDLGQGYCFISSLINSLLIILLYFFPSTNSRLEEIALRLLRPLELCAIVKIFSIKNKPAEIRKQDFIVRISFNIGLHYRFATTERQFQRLLIGRLHSDISLHGG